MQAPRRDHIRLPVQLLDPVQRLESAARPGNVDDHHQGRSGRRLEVWRNGVQQSEDVSVEPVQFAENEAKLAVFHESGRQFGIPLKPDGTFQIGWMPIGKYSMMLERTSQNPAKKGPQKTMHNVPDGLTIEEGKKDYVIELGKGFKP